MNGGGLRLVVVALTLGLGACAAPHRQGTSAAEGPCSTPRSAAAGAVLGALAGALVGGRDAAVKGAALGAIAGAVVCTDMTVRSRQTKTAAQVDAEQRRSPTGRPASPTLLSYSPRLVDVSVTRGSPARVTSVLELSDGTSGAVREVVEEIVIVDPVGQQFRSGSKSFSAASAGRFENSFEIVLPQQAPIGRYTLSTNVYLNGKLATSRSVYLQVV